MAGGGTEISRAFVTLGAEMGNLQRGLQQGQQMVYGAVGNMQQSFGRLQGTLNTILGFAGFSLTGMGIYSLGKRLLFAGDAAVKLKNNITTMLEGNEAKADQLVQRMREFTALTPFSEQQVSTAITAFLPFEKEIDKLFEMLTSLGDAASVSAQGLMAFPRVTRAITQMMGKNKISAEEMMQLAEAGIPAWKSLAAAMGVSVAEVQQMSVKGKLGADAIHKFVAQLGKDFAGSMEKQSRTIEGLLSTITDNIKVKAVKAFQPLYEAAQSTFGKVAAYVQSSEFAAIMDNVGQVSKAVTGSIVLLGIGFKNLNDMAGGWIGKGALITVGGTAMVGVFMLLKSVFMMTIGAAVALAFKGMVSLATSIASATIATTVFSAKLLINATIMLATLPTSIASATAAFIAFSGQAIATAITAVAAFSLQISALMPVLLGVAAGIAIVAAGVYAFSQSNAWDAIARRGTDASNRVKSAWSDAWDEIKSSTMETFIALKAAFEAGDLVGAMELVWLQIKLYWISGVTALKTTWTEFKSWMASMMISLGELITEGFMAPLRWINDKMADMLAKFSSLPGAEMMMQAAIGITPAQAAEMLDAMYPSKEDVKKRFADIQKTLNDDRDRAIKEGKQAEEDAMEEIEQRRAELFNEAQRKEVAARMARLAAGATGEEVAKAGEKEGGLAGKGSPFVGIAELNRKMQEALLGKGPLLTETEKQTGILEQIRDGEGEAPGAAAAGEAQAAAAPNRRFGFRLAGDEPTAAMRAREEREARNAMRVHERRDDKILAEERIRQKREERAEAQALARDRAERRRQEMQAEREARPDAAAQRRAKERIDAELALQRGVRQFMEQEEPGLFLGEGAGAGMGAKPTIADLNRLLLRKTAAQGSEAIGAAMDFVGGIGGALDMTGMIKKQEDGNGWLKLIYEKITGTTQEAPVPANVFGT